MRTSVTLSTSGPDEQPVRPDLHVPAATVDNSSDVQHNDQSSPTRPFQLTPKRKKAIEAVRFIAAHLKNEDDYAEVTVHDIISFCLAYLHTFVSFISSFVRLLVRPFVSLFI